MLGSESPRPRTVPFVSKATGLPLAKIAARRMAGTQPEDQGVTGEVVPPYHSVKEAVFPSSSSPGRRYHPRARMKSTGEVMGSAHLRRSLVKSRSWRRRAANCRLRQGFLSVKHGDKAKAAGGGRQPARGWFHRSVATRHRPCHRGGRAAGAAEGQQGDRRPPASST